jgi:hypothetical protein
MNKETQEIPEKVLHERRKWLQREREQANHFMNNIIIKMTKEHEEKSKDLEDERKEM